MASIIFAGKSSEDLFFTEVREQVTHYLKFHKIDEKKSILTKIFFFGMMLCMAYSGLIFISYDFLSVQLFYLWFGFTALLTAFNFAHDASHLALPFSKKWNDRIYVFLFALLGANPYLWKIRHTQSHHLYANIHGADADLDDSFLVRLSPEVSLRKFHKFQHLYAPVLYLFYTLVWIFYKDFATFFRTKIGNLENLSHPRKEFIKLIVFKLLYILVWLGIPMLLIPVEFWQIGLAFIFTHFVMSLFLIFTFLISHFVEETYFSEKKNGIMSVSWASHQLDVCVDFHAKSPIANWIFGGFNTHLAHHLFPNICHIHYPAITRRLELALKRHSLPYKSVNFAEGIVSHIRFLKKMGN